METESGKMLSIIVPVYNVELYVERCLCSLFAQDMSRDDYEILIVNDGSTDNSLSVVVRIIEGEKNVRVFTKPNGGLSSARNYAMPYAQGKYIMYVDSDDFLEPNIIGRIVKLAEQYELDLLFFLSKFYPTNIVANFQPFMLHQIYTGEYILLNGMKVSSVWSNLYSRAFLDAIHIKFYEGISHEDIEYNYRLYPFAKKIMFTNLIAYNYNLEGESLTRTTNKVKIEKNNIDSLIVAHNVKEFAKCSQISQPLRELLTKRMNSSVVSQFLYVVRDGSLDTLFFDRFLLKAIDLNLYPVVGKCESWKMTALSKIFNILSLLKMAYSLFKFKTQLFK